MFGRAGDSKGSPFGGLYRAKGGDEALRQRYEMLLEVAQSRNLVDTDEAEKSFVPEGLKAAGARVLDLLSRPTYAVAGAVDTMLGQGRPGEYVPQRMWRELTGGGDKEFFGDVLEQAGVPEGLKLSDVVGTDTWVTKRWDPTARGAFGLGLDLALDPLNTISKPFNFATKVLTEGGELLTLSAKGRKAFDKLLSEQIAPWRAKLGLADDVDDAVVIAKAMSDSEFMAQAKHLADNLTDVNAGLDTTRAVVAMERKAASALQEQVRGGARDLLEKRGLRVRLPGGLVDLPVGLDQALEKSMGKLWTSARAAAEGSETWQPILRDFDKFVGHIDSLFQRVPLLARRLPGYDRLQAEHWMMQHGSEMAATGIAADVVGQVPQKLLKNKELWYTFHMAVEDHTWRSHWIRAAEAEGLPDAAGLLQRWDSMMEVMGAREVSAKLLDKADFDMLRGHYAPRILDASPDDIAKIEAAWAGRGSKFRGGDLGGFKEPRKAPTFEAFYETAKKLGLADKVILDPFEVMRRRVAAHQRALLAQEFTENVVSMFGVTNSRQVQALREHMKATANRDLTADEEQIVSRLLREEWAGSGRKAADAEIRRRLMESGRGKATTARVKAAEDTRKDVAGRLERARAQAKAALAFKRREQGKAWAAAAAEVRRLTSSRADLPELTETLTLLRGEVRSATALEVNFNRQVQQFEKAIEVFDGSTILVRPKGLRERLQKHRDLVAETRKLFDDIRGGAREKIAALEGKYEEIRKSVREFDRELDRLSAVRDYTDIQFEKAAAEYARARTAREGLAQLSKAVRKEGVAARREARALTLKAEREANLRLFESLPKEAQAKLADQLLGRVRNIGDFERILKTYGKAFDELPAGVLEAARTEKGMFTYAGQEFVKSPTLVGIMGGRSVLVPKGIAQDFERMKGQWQQNPEVRSLLRLLDYATNTFKVGVTTYFPAFNVRNGYNNVFASAIDIALQALNGAAHADAIKIMGGHDGTLRMHNGRKLPYEALRSEVKALGFLDDKGSFIERTGRKGAFDPLGKTKVGAWIQNRAGDVEIEAKVLHYLALRRRGYTVGDAARHVNQFLFDYADLSPFEKNVMRRIIPFYTWSRKNVERQVRTILERPGRAAMQAKLANNDRGPDADMLPEYLRGTVMVKLENGFLTNIDIPLASIDQLWAGGVGKTLREHINTINPLMKMPMELALDIDTFDGKNIRGRKWLGQLGPALEGNLPKWAKEWLEIESVTLQSGEVAYKANGLKMYLLMKGLFLGRFISTGATVDQMVRELGNGDTKKGSLAAMRFLTGMTLREMDLSDRDAAVLQNRIRRLEDILIESGAMVEFKKRYIPKEVSSRGGAPGASPFGGGGGSRGTSPFGGK